jgi:glycosyltransferase involved in cell wall biosynthesis
MNKILGSEAPLTFGSRRDPNGEQLRILTFTTLYPNAEQPNHGIFVETRLRQLLASGKVRSTVIAPVPYFPFRTRFLPQWSRYASIPFHEIRHDIEIFHPRYPVIPRVGMAISPTLLVAGAISLAKRLHSSKRFDVIDAHYFYPDGVAAIRLGRSLDLPVVITARGSDINLIPRYRIPGQLIRQAVAEANGIIAVSAALKKALIELGAGPDIVQVLRNGVDVDLFKPVDREVARQKLALTRRTLISVGNLLPAKGHGDVISALPALPEYDLLILGEGPDRSRLDELARRIGLAERVRLLGSIPHQDLPLFYGAADALVLASHREGWPNVLLEAMACGTPVVASNVGGIPEAVQTPEAGLIFYENTPERIAGAVQTLFANLPAREATRAYAERFNWDDVTAGQLTLFSRLVKENRRKRHDA